MAKDVLCEVNSCRFWAAGNHCGAASIYVVSNRGKQATPKKQIAKRLKQRYNEWLYH